MHWTLWRRATIWRCMATCPRRSPRHGGRGPRRRPDRRALRRPSARSRWCRTWPHRRHGGVLGLGATGIRLGCFGPAIAAMCFFRRHGAGRGDRAPARAVSDWGRIRDAAARGADAEPCDARPAAPPRRCPCRSAGAGRGGQVLTVAGPSGAGKSTLLARIAGLIPPAPEQPIMLAGRPVQDWPGGRAACPLVLVPQRVALIAGTLRENLALANPDASDAQMHRCPARDAAGSPRAAASTCGWATAAPGFRGESRRVAGPRRCARRRSCCWTSRPRAGRGHRPAGHGRNHGKNSTDGACRRLASFIRS